MVGAYAVYASNGTYLGSYDSAPNSLLVRNALQTGRLDFDRFRGSALVRGDAAYAFVEAPNGHLSSIFPIGAALVSAPVVVALAGVERLAGAHEPPLTEPAAEPFRQADERIVADVLAALSVGLFLACACLIGTPLQAGIATAVYALCTPIWTIASQALWQHGPVNLAILGMIYALLRAGRSAAPGSRAAWLAVAGLCAGLLPVIRPTAALFSLAGLGVTAWTQRRRTGWFVAGAVAGLAPGIGWNLTVFHTLAGGYAGNARSFAFDPRRAAAVFAALLISPNRGLFVFAPVLLFAIPGAVRAARGRTTAGLLLAWLGAACVALVGTYAFFDYWWAGITYGPRFLTDTVAIASLLLIFAIPASRLGRVAFGLAAFASLVVQFAGANGGAAGSDWNTVPISIDFAPARAWQLRDGQIERNVRGAYYRFFPPARDGAMHATAGNLTLAPVRATDDSPWLAARAEVTNDGPATLYGYASGRYAGQVRVRMRLVDRSSGAPLAEQMLYVADTLAPGERGIATGVVRRPPVPFRAELVVWRI
jgi:hypothetical protein